MKTNAHISFPTGFLALGAIALVVYVTPAAASLSGSSKAGENISDQATLGISAYHSDITGQDSNRPDESKVGDEEPAPGAKPGGAPEHQAELRKNLKSYLRDHAELHNEFKQPDYDAVSTEKPANRDRLPG